MGKVRWRRFQLDPVLAVCFAALFAFPVAASVVAAGQPLGTEGAAPAAQVAGGAAAPLRVVPAFSAGSAHERGVRSESLLTEPAHMRAAVSRALRDLVGPRRAVSVMRVITEPVPLVSEPAGQEPRYPFRYGRLEPLLDAALCRPLSGYRAAQANDAGALLTLAAAGGMFENAAQVAFALLERARDGRSCGAQLNLAFLLSTHVLPKDRLVEAEFARAERLCPGDLAPTWMLGQFQSRRARADVPQLIRRPLATFRRLQRRAPRSALGWSGEGDTELRLGYQHAELQPFTARAHFRRALQLFRRAQQVDPSAAVAAGAARALAGMREYGAAVREQRHAVAGRSTLAPVAARQVEYLERDHRFAAAAAVARPLIVAPRFVPARSLVVEGPLEQFLGILDGPVFDDDIEGPLSIGVDRAHPVSLDLTGEAGVLGANAVADLSFIPEFRAVSGVTGHDRWCPSWSRPRDLLLSGDPSAARTALPRRTIDIRGGGPCQEELAPLAAMVELEAGNESRALALADRSGLDVAEEEPIIAPRPTAFGRRLAGLYEAQQNMWRFAGRHERARVAAQEWLRRLPRDAAAADRLGEIAFLSEDYRVAARWFAMSLRLTRSTRRGWTSQEAFALLKQGTALRLAGRADAAVASLERADEVASRAEAQHGEDRAPVFASYHARVQAGDAHLRARRYAAAAEAYDAAREREPQMRGFDERALSRPEALHNNQAIAEAKIGDRDAAVAAARMAVGADPGSPVFLATEGFALRRAGRLREAERAYRAALRADPTAYTVWNDLGVVLGRRGRFDDAAQAFRRAVGVDDDYAIGWFNLGVAQGAAASRTRWPRRARSAARSPPTTACAIASGS